MNVPLVIALLLLTGILAFIGTLLLFRWIERRQRSFIDILATPIRPRHDPCVWDDERLAQLLNSTPRADC